MHSTGTTPFDTDASQAKDFDPSGWELALVSAPSTNLSSVQERQLVCSLSVYSFANFLKGELQKELIPQFQPPPPPRGFTNNPLFLSKYKVILKFEMLRIIYNSPEKAKGRVFLSR